MKARGSSRQAAMLLNQRTLVSTPPKATLLIRLLVGVVFLSEGIQKFLFPATLGVGRFLKIGIPAPQIMAPFVGGVDVVCGSLVVLGLLSRWATLPLLAVIPVAIATTKLPMLFAGKFCGMAHESRVDYSMLMGLLFLLAVGPGPLSADRHLTKDSAGTERKGF
ncbi:MAG TPA: DoxX family protein [Bryobacteraceae bacterium]|nr:DoxX family protein [Bryobacteraceae bacterium]